MSHYKEGRNKLPHLLVQEKRNLLLQTDILQEKELVLKYCSFAQNVHVARAHLDIHPCNIRHRRIFHQKKQYNLLHQCTNQDGLIAQSATRRGKHRKALLKLELLLMEFYQDYLKLQLNMG